MVIEQNAAFTIMHVLLEHYRLSTTLGSAS